MRACVRVCACVCCAPNMCMYCMYASVLTANACLDMATGHSLLRSSIRAVAKGGRARQPKDVHLAE